MNVNFFFVQLSSEEEDYGDEAFCRKIKPEESDSENDNSDYDIGVDTKRLLIEEHNRILTDQSQTEIKNKSNETSNKEPFEYFTSVLIDHEFVSNKNFFFFKIKNTHLYCKNYSCSLMMITPEIHLMHMQLHCILVINLNQ